MQVVLKLIYIMSINPTNYVTIIPSSPFAVEETMAKRELRHLAQVHTGDKSQETLDSNQFC